jgi:hypothetical protein
MDAAMTAAGADYTSLDAETIHDWANQEFDPDAIVTWLDARITESGGTPGPPSLTPPATGTPVVTFVGHNEFYDPDTAWPGSLSVSGAPTGTVWGDRLFLTVVGEGSTELGSLDNWNLPAGWTLVNSTIGVIGAGSLRTVFHTYTARYGEVDLPVVISPRTAGGTLITGATWYRAHLYAVTPSHPVNLSDLAQGNTTNLQPYDGRASISGDISDYLLQFTTVANPSGRTLGAITSPGGAIGTYTQRSAKAAVSGRGGVVSIADTTASGSFSGSAYALYDITESGSVGTPIRVRSILMELDAVPDEELPPPPPDPCTGLEVVDVPAADPTTFILDGETITITALTGTGGTIYGAEGSGLVADGADYADPAIYVAAGYGTLLEGTPVNYSVTASLVGSGCTLTADPTVRLVGVVDGVGTVIATGTATDTGGDVWHLSLSHVLADTWSNLYVITTAPTECV